MLVLDDLQWADKGSLLLLGHLAATELAPNVLVLGTFRDSELAHADALRATLGVLYRHPGVSRVDLGGLDDAGVVALLEAIAGYALDAATRSTLAHAVYRETDGNPFFVTQVLQHLVENGSLYQDAERTVGDVGVVRPPRPARQRARGDRRSRRAARRRARVGCSRSRR